MGAAIPQAGRTSAPARSSRADALGFALLLAVNAVLFIRPAELIPQFRGWPIYEVLILACCFVTLPGVIDQATRRLSHRPINLCVLGLLVAVVMSHLSRGFIWGARHSGPEFAKLVLFYLLVVALVTTPQRFARLMKSLWLFIVLLTVLALLQYHHLIDVPALRAYQEAQPARIDPVTGGPLVIERLCSAGIFNDPNDLCLILLFGTMLSLFVVLETRWAVRRIVCAGAVMMFLWSISLTHSRGGFLALIACVAVLMYAKLGFWRTVVVGLFFGPMLLYMFAGRQTEITPSEGTSLSRLQLWSEALQLFKRAPLFGIGMDQFVERTNFVVHNSFLQSFVELGLFGGTLFLAAFWLSFRALAALPAQPQSAADVELARFRPYLLAILAAYFVGNLSLSRSYSVPTYLLLAVIACYARLSPRADGKTPRVTLALAVRMIALSVIFIAGVYVFIRVFVRWG